MARLGLRKNELRLLRWRDVDHYAGELRVKAKGGKRPTIPVVYDNLCADLATLALDAKPEHYLLHPTRVGNLPLQEVIVRFPDRPMQASTMHRWWVRCLRQAGMSPFPDARTAPYPRN
jgi:integrase